jgi:predicted transcriptional regulator
MEYWSYGQNPVTEWVFDSNASWLAWESTEHKVYGTPDNNNIGVYYVRVNIKDSQGNYDEHLFNLQVQNTPPNITTADITATLEDEIFYVDYNCNDDGQGNIKWIMVTNASWLGFNNATGEILGTPSNSDRGSFWVNVTVYDGNGGTDWTNFTLTVTDVNDPPVITTTDVTIVDEDSFYMVVYNAVDIDGDSDFKWYLNTDASWLSINGQTGILAGTPLNEHVGFNYVNVTVKDPKDGEASSNFTIEVVNTNDPPIWIQVPLTTEINESDVFAVNIQAIDVDEGDELSYQMDHKAPFEIRLDNETGEIVGKADLEIPRSEPLAIEINIYATDGNITIWKSFDLTVIPNLRPEADLLSPTDNARVGSLTLKLKWSGSDPSGDKLTYDVYLSKSMTDVIELNESTRILYNTEETTYSLEELDEGTIYYWTVIPFDGLNYGQCVDNVLGFVTNSPPEFPEITFQTVRADSRYELDINARDNNLDDVPKFEYGLIGGPEGLSISNETGEISWFPSTDQVGTHTVTVWVSDGFDTTNMTFEITVTEPPEVVDRDLKPIIITTSSLTILLIILSIFIAGTEVGKYKFFSILFVPMYNKLHPDKVLDNYTRGKIHGYIQAKPGEHYNSIKSALKLNNGTLTHHARVLEKEGFIYSRRDGLYTRFFPTGVKLKAMEIASLNDIQKKMVESLHKYPGMAQHEIISMLEITQQVGSYHLNNLARDDYIMAEQLNGEKKYYINYDKLSITDEE